MEAASVALVDPESYDEFKSALFLPSGLKLLLVAFMTGSAFEMLTSSGLRSGAIGNGFLAILCGYTLSRLAPESEQQKKSLQPLAYVYLYCSIQKNQFK